ncbi:S1C family serine protease [Winogradskyella sp.]|uniref:S1C family serine protease n=1 Tax=Winogradskyella sp. TaxID=1883156 RepID=UPI003AB90CAB
MNKKLKIIMVLVLVINFAYSQSAKEIAKNCMSSTVSLIMEDNYRQPISLGSGFIIGDGKVVTNLHVIEGAKYGSVIINGSSNKHKIEGYFAIDKENDLAVLSVPTLTEKALPMSNTVSPEIGEKIYAIGNPKGLSGTISEGIVSGIRSFKDRNLIQITAPISPGSSGGPVINNNGEVVGVAVGTLTSGQNLNFAIPISSLISLVDKSSSTITSLNISKGVTAQKTSENEINVKDGIEIRDWNYDRGCGFRYKDKTCIESISVRNKLPYKVKNIKTIFILFDNTGIPIDYFEEELFSSYGDEGIRPFLAKTIEFDIFDWKDHPALRKSAGDKLEIRILDFEIVED